MFELLTYQVGDNISATSHFFETKEEAMEWLGNIICEMSAKGWAFSLHKD